jgi:hypothetical protein
LTPRRFARDLPIGTIFGIVVSMLSMSLHYKLKRISIEWK